MCMRVKEFNKCCKRFARKHGYSINTVKTVTELRNAARAEWWAR